MVLGLLFCPELHPSKSQVRIHPFMVWSWYLNSPHWESIVFMAHCLMTIISWVNTAIQFWVIIYFNLTNNNTRVIQPKNTQIDARNFKNVDIVYLAILNNHPFIKKKIIYLSTYVLYYSIDEISMKFFI